MQVPFLNIPLSCEVDLMPFFCKFYRSKFLLLITLCLFECKVVIAQVTELDLRDSILGKKVFTVQELTNQDLNSDGQVDVTDLIYYLGDQNLLLEGVNFKVSESLVNEGDGALNLEVSISPDYQGTINYIISGQATSGEDYSVGSGSIEANGGVATISIPILEDLLLEDVESIIVTLLPQIGYKIGSSQQHISYIIDNDSNWFGAINIDGLVLRFDMTIATDGVITQSSIKSTEGYAIPAGDWPVSLQMTSSKFYAEIGPIDIAPEDTLLSASFKRTLKLEADILIDGHAIEYDNQIRGKMTEELSFVSQAYLDRSGTNEVQGVFSLIKQIPNIPLADSGLTVLK
jgi:hypothetical protein